MAHSSEALVLPRLAAPSARTHIQTLGSVFPGHFPPSLGRAKQSIRTFSRLRRGPQLRDDRQYATAGPYVAEVDLIFPPATSQASPTSRLLRIKAVCDRWHPMTEEPLPAEVHAKTALILRPRAVAPPGWDEADGKISRGVCVRTGFSCRARQESEQGGITETHGYSETVSELGRSRSERRVPRPSKLVVTSRAHGQRSTRRPHPVSPIPCLFRES
jgi:hypothetical protein